MANWYFAVDAQTQGPVSEDELRALARRGELKPGHFVVPEGEAAWRTVGAAEADLGLSQKPWGGYADVPPPTTHGGAPGASATRPGGADAGDATATAEARDAPVPAGLAGWGSPHPGAGPGPSSGPQLGEPPRTTWGSERPWTADPGAAPPWGGPSGGAADQGAPPRQDAPGWGQPPTQPGWVQPGQPGQPDWGQPPNQPGWGQPGWGQAPGQWGSGTGYSGAYATVALGPGGAPYAEWWQRLVAKLIDTLVLLVPSLLVVFTLLWSDVRDQLDEGDSTFRFEVTGRTIVASLLSGLIGLLYYAYFNGRGQTLGKMIMRIQVVRADVGGPIGFAKGLTRHIVQFFANAPLLNYVGWIFILVDSLWPLRDPARRSIHDRMAGSVVVRTR